MAATTLKSYLQPSMIDSGCGTAPHALLRRLAWHDILQAVDDLHVQVRLLEPQPFRGFHADGLQTLLLIFGKAENPFATFDGWRKLLATLLSLATCLAPGLQTPQQFQVQRLVRLGLGVIPPALPRWAAGAGSSPKSNCC